MRHTLKILALALAVLFLAACLVAAVGPFLVPVPPLEGTVPPEQLADPDSRFVDIDGVTVHYKVAGEGEPAIVLLHGFAASLFSWREVMPVLAESHRVVAFDRPAFGLTERPLPDEWQGDSPYGPAAQVRLTIGLMDELGIDRAVLAGNSAGGTVAVQTALEHPDRVEALVLVDAAVYSGGGGPGWLRLVSGTPQARRLGPLFVRSIRNWGIDFGRSAWHDPTQITPEIWAGYTLPLRAEHWDVGLWELVRASRDLHLEERLAELQLPVLVVTGDDDRIVPTEQSIRLAGELPDAELAVIPNCGHVPHEECPAEFLKAWEEWKNGRLEGRTDASFRSSNLPIPYASLNCRR